MNEGDKRTIQAKNSKSKNSFQSKTKRLYNQQIYTK